MAAFPQHRRIDQFLILFYYLNLFDFRWGETDSCTLLLTPSAELYIISKVSGGHGLIAEIPSQGWSQSTPVPLASNTHLDGVTSTHGDPLGGDISPDGKEILIKVRDQVLHYTISAGSDIIRK